MAPPSRQRLQPYRVIVANDTPVEAVAALSDLGKYVAVDVQSNEHRPPRPPTTATTTRYGSGVAGSIKASTRPALRNKVPANVIEDMVRIYSYDVDFQRKVQPWRLLRCVLSTGEDEGSAITEKTEVLYASLTVGGETKKYYRFQTPDDLCGRLL